MPIEEAVDLVCKNKNQVYTVGELTWNLTYIAKHTGINRRTLLSRLKGGKTIEEAVQIGPGQEIYTVNGFTGSLTNISEHFGLSFTALKSRLHDGFSIEEVINVPLKHVLTANLEFNGQKGSMKELCQIFNKDFVEVYNKCKHTHTFEWAMETTISEYKGE